jgi:bacterioferritin (cytochrome b1)
MPQPQPGIVGSLQTTLKVHLSQAEAYETQSAHFFRWGYPALGAKYAKYAADERHHAKLATDRLEFFDATPEVAHLVTPWPRYDFEGIIQSNYAGDQEAAIVERSGYMNAVSVGDAATAEIFAELLEGSEDGMAEIEAIRMVIAQIGLDNYLANQTQHDAVPPPH